MDKKVKKGFVISVIVLAVIIIGYFVYVSGPEISTQGYSMITATPDLISVSVSMEGRDVDSQIAQEKAIAISDKFLTELEGLGIASEDIELSNYYTYPDYDWQTSKIKGYVASQQVIVRLTDFSKTGEIIRAASNSGALVSGINFELSTIRQNEYKASALKEASMDARTKADAVAEGFGKRIGKLVSVQSQDFSYYPYPYYTRDTMAVSNAGAEKAVVDMSPTDLEVSASVSATYTMTRF